MSSSDSASPRISIVVPVFNEAESLVPLDAQLAAALDPLETPYEVLYIDDGSTDETGTALESLRSAERRSHGRVRVLRLPVNRGQSAAFAAGFHAARAPIVVTLDADLQNDPADIPRLLEALDSQQADVVCGVRHLRRDSWTRRAASRFANAVRNRLTSESIQDVGCSLRAYRSEFLARIPLFDGAHRFLPTLLRRAGARIIELPVHHRSRKFGVSKYGIVGRLRRTTFDLCGVRWLLRRWIDPDEASESTPG